MTHTMYPIDPAHVPSTLRMSSLSRCFMSSGPRKRGCSFTVCFICLSVNVIVRRGCGSHSLGGQPPLASDDSRADHRAASPSRPASACCLPPIFSRSCLLPLATCRLPLASYDPAARRRLIITIDGLHAYHRIPECRDVSRARPGTGSIIPFMFHCTF